MALTARDLFNEALSYLAVVGAGQAASEEDFETVKALFPPLLAELSARGDYYLAPETAVEETIIGDDVFLALGELLANEAAPRFGKAKMPRQQREEAIARLRIVTQAQPTGAVLRTCYF